MKTTLTDRPVEKVIAAIDALDLESVKVRMMDPELGEGWTREYADGVEQGYRNYLTMLAKYQDHAEDILLSKDVDEFWHTHILQTIKYTEDCERVFGTYLHHNPHVGERTAEDLEKRAALAEKTRRLYRQEFGNADGIAWVGGRAKDVAWSSAAVRAENAAWSSAAVRARTAAWSSASIRDGNAAWSAASKVGDAAWSSAAVRAENAAWSSATIRTENAAWSSVVLKAGNAAWSSAVIEVKDAAWSSAAIRTEKAAWSSVVIKTGSAAWSSAVIKAGDAAWSSAAIRAESVVRPPQ